MKKIKKIAARKLRKNQTPLENKVWKILRDRKFMNLKFRRQPVIKGFIVDFYCFEYNLAIEVDGEIHNERKDYDKERDVILNSLGVKVIRIKNAQIEKDESIVSKRILAALNSPTSPSGRGSQTIKMASNKIR